MKSVSIDRRRVLVALADSIVVMSSLVTAFYLRFDFDPPSSELALLSHALWIAVSVKALVFLMSGIDKCSWRYVGLTDLLRLLWTNLVASTCFTAGALLSVGPPFAKSVYLIDFMICFLATAASRFAVRLYVEVLPAQLSRPRGKGVLIYGAGAAGMLLLREIRSNPALGYNVVGFLDDNAKMHSTVRMNVPVLGCGRDAAAIVRRCKGTHHEIEEIVIAMPSATGRQMREAVAHCRAADVSCKTLPGLGKLLTDQVLTAQIRNVSLEDLLGREQVRMEEQRIQLRIAGRSVLVTGAAGSIGSELCRQIARFKPGRLIALDQAESELFRIDLELREKFPELSLTAEVGDIRDARRIDEIIRQHEVDSVFHAAAYKHVPMMEAHALEAVRNNVLGTWNVVEAAARNRVPNFLMISSDKAVNPTSIMGATKRVAELIVSAAAEGAGRKTTFVSVRFGNVLGSNGSVVPLFQQQIARGGPVTVTHPNIRRYFMSVQEAVQLVLQASTMGHGSEIFVLDMGEPIRIVDLAQNMIRLAGLTPHEDIEIRMVGLRPGEKLYEELTSQGENIVPTYHEKIKIFKGPNVRAEEIENWIRGLDVLLRRRNPLTVVEHLKQLVPEYRPDGAWAAVERPLSTAVGNEVRR